MRLPIAFLLSNFKRYPRLFALVVFLAFVSTIISAPAVMADGAVPPSQDVWPGFLTLGERLIDGWTKAHWFVQVTTVAAVVACFWIWSRSRPGVDPAVLGTINKTLDTINGAMEEQSSQMRNLREDMSDLKSEFHAHLQACPPATRYRAEA